MAQNDISFILSFLKTDPQKADLRALLAQFHDVEAAMDGPNVQRIPYFRWHHNISDDQEKQMQTMVQSVCNRGEPAPETIAVAAGLLMRVTDGEPAAVQMLKPMVPDLLKRCRDQTIMLELGNLFRALPNWPLLQQVASAAVALIPGEQWQCNIACDWLVLANYRLLVKKFESNTMLPSDIKEFETEIDGLAEKIGEDTKNIAFYRSLTATLNRQSETAIDWKLKAQTLPGKILVLFRRLENFVPVSSLKRQPSSCFAQLESGVVHHFTHPAPEAGVLLVSTDKRYFELYAEKLLESFAYWNSGCLIHLHCINFEPASDQLAALERHHTVKINHSVDSRPELESAPNLYAGYCAGARYLFLPRYLEHYGRVAVSDIDGVIRVPLAALWQDDNCAIHLTSKLVSPEWTSTRLLWEAIAAGSFAIADAPPNRDFAWMLANYLAEQINFCRDNDLRLFYTDQIGLLLAYVASKDVCDFRPLAGLFSQQGRWQFSGAGDVKARFQNNVDYKKPLK